MLIVANYICQWGTHWKTAKIGRQSTSSPGVDNIGDMKTKIQEYEYNNEWQPLYSLGQLGICVRHYRPGFPSAK